MFSIMGLTNTLDLNSSKTTETNTTETKDKISSAKGQSSSEFNNSMVTG